ncbi:hypothetical protein B0J13DRAFT_2458 [Dactylonectria estremocensis]|uniref:LrgB-like protein n=1 Tax=Dactylonectria estremocensis TaxID=1079267 RepID=A0A9P9JD72_9HYPO|nr:hypothetical protein B0J13DRAFT_2458 [Dactylonectria estremocensis]
MAAARLDVSEILRRLDRCLRPSYGRLRPVLASLGQLATWPVKMFQTNRDNPTMAVSSNIWRERRMQIANAVLFFFWVTVVYLASELVIWGLSRAWDPADLSYFSSISGMALLFITMAIASRWVENIDDIYKTHIKEKIDFINSHLGLGFPIPLVMLNQNELLDGTDIARIIGNFAVTNLASWTAVFGLALVVTSAAINARSRTSQECCGPPIMQTPPQVEISWPSNSTLQQSVQMMANSREKSRRGSTLFLEAESSAATTRRSSMDECTAETLGVSSSSTWNTSMSYFPLLASFFSIFLVGFPTAFLSKDDRVLDGCVLWFVWATTLRLQRNFKRSPWFSSRTKMKNATVTIMNPVLITTLLMTSYIRAKAYACDPDSLHDILHKFSSGTPLYALWSSAVTSIPLPAVTPAWFGAGDAALSVLECGILIWGFKLYECQRQLFSCAGALTILISVAAAAGNVFLSALSAQTLGLAESEALAFAARSTTLALAKPAMAAVSGNLGVNAALVVSNGILGQLLYPVVLDKLGVKGTRDGVSSQGGVNPLASEESEGTLQDRGPNSRGHDLVSADDPVAIAAGVAIGINGAVMGVSYLYETRSRAAPYAALSMSVFGVMTVMFTTVEPFKGVLQGLANR